METRLAGKSILIIEDEIVFRSLMAAYLNSMGATIQQASNGFQALSLLEAQSPDLILCDLAMPEMGGIKFVECLLLQGINIPILVISATDKLADIAMVLRMGVKDVLLKPITDLNRMREAVLACLYPTLFTSSAVEEVELIQNWEVLRKNPHEAAQLLQQLQPPVQQTVAHCRVNYRQLTMAEQLGFVLDIAALSENDLAFYCLDVTQAGDKGILAALLLRVLFSRILREHLTYQRQSLSQMSSLLRQVNQLLRQTHLEGEYPLLAGYYNTKHKNLILVSAGLDANISINNNSDQTQLNNSVPLGTLDTRYLDQVYQHCNDWQCHVFGKNNQLKLMLSAE